MIVLLLALLLTAVPESADWILHVWSGKDHCHGAPIGLTQILTASHCIGKDGEAEWVGQNLSGKARLSWRDEKRDLAMLTTDTPQTWRPLKIAKRKPGPAAQGWIRTFLPRLRSVVAPTTILGTDDDDDLDFIGYAAPGASGSPLLDEVGEIVGVVKFVWNPHEARQRPADWQALLLVLQDAVKIMPAASATPITDWPKPPKESR